MAKVEIKICDRCKKEERSDGEPKYWTNYHSGRIILDLRSAPNVQIDFSKDCLCRMCAYKLKDVLDDFFNGSCDKKNSD